MKELITQIENHLAVCAPHIKEREQCQLLIKALERLKFLEEESKFLHTGIGQIKNHKEELKRIILSQQVHLREVNNLWSAQNCKKSLQRKMDKSKLF